MINRNTRALIINNPLNPCGKILCEEDMKALIDLTKNNNIFIISDEVYEYIVFDNQKHQSVCAYPELTRRSFKVGSFGKSLHVTGWKVGYCMAPASLTHEVRKIHQFLTFSTSTPLQYGIASYLKERTDTLRNLRHFYQEKRDFFNRLMQGSRFQPLACQGTYFQLFSFQNISDETEEDFNYRLIREHGVAAIPISVLRSNNKNDAVLRFCFAKKLTTLEQAAEALCKI